MGWSSVVVVIGGKFPRSIPIREEGEVHGAAQENDMVTSEKNRDLWEHYG